MLKITNRDKGIYILEINAEKDFTISTKTFSNFLFKKGFYYYVGSAQKNFRSRILRHLKKEKIINWHIDHITTKTSNKIVSVYLFQNMPKNFECELVQTLTGKGILEYSANNFGNSDCKICDSHLLYSEKKIPYSHFSRLYQSIVRFKPSSKDIS